MDTASDVECDTISISSEATENAIESIFRTNLGNCMRSNSKVHQLDEGEEILLLAPLHQIQSRLAFRC